jgi:hypothetical protein
VFGVKEKVMGTTDATPSYTNAYTGQSVGQGTGHSTGGSVHNAADTVSAKLSDAGEAISDAPHQVKTKTQGNPLAAGLIAFGAGMLLSALIPASEKEREAADALKTAAEPMTTELTEAAKDMAQGLKEPAREAMENVKTTATDAAQNVKAEGQTAATDVKDRAADAKDNVQNS